MGTYNSWVDGYLAETTYGTSLIANTNTQTSKFGILSEEAIHPSPETGLVYGGTGTSKEVPAGAVWKGPELLRGAYTVVLQNGVLLWMVMGTSLTAALIHTITPKTSGYLPSITIQHDLTGSAANWGTQYKGCQVAKIELNCSFKEQYLWATVDWAAQLAEHVAFISTNLPVLPPTETINPYIFGALTCEFDDVSFRSNLIDMQFSISPDFIYWNDNSRTALQPIESDRKKYQLRFTHTPADSTFWDELVATGNTKDMWFKWTKSVDDYIKLIFSDIQVIGHEQKSPTKEKALEEVVTCVPRAVSIEVKDALADSNYGE